MLTVNIVWFVLPDRLAYFFYYTHIIAQIKLYVKYYTHTGNLKFEIVSRMIGAGRGVLGRF